MTRYVARNILRVMILSFSCPDARAVFEGHCPPRFRFILRVLERKLSQLDAARTLEFLRSPPGNRLEKLAGNRAGQYSIRINDQWRVCFIWTGSDAESVEIVDYH